MAYKRVYDSKKKVQIIGAGTLLTVLTIIASLSVYGIQLSVSGDMACRGTIDDPCLAYFNISVSNYSLQFTNSFKFDVEPSIKSMEIYKWHGGYKKWLPYNFTGKTLAKSATPYQFKVVALKNNPQDVIKWGVGYGLDYKDPWWTGTPDFVINETSHFDAGTYVNTSSTTNEYNHTANALELSFPYALKHNNLTNYFRFDTSTTSFINETGGTADCGYCPVYTASGKFDGGFDFVPVNFDVIPLGARPKPSNFTINLWVNPDAWTNAGIVTSCNNIGSDGTIWGLVGRDTGDLLEVWTSNGATSQLCTIIGWNSTGVPTGSWTLLTATANGTDLAIYKNGALLKNCIRTKWSAGTGYNLTIGRLGEYNSWYYDGKMDEVKIYNESLSATEILSLYNLGDRYINTTMSSPTANWTSATQTMTASSYLKNFTVNYTGFDQNHYIDRIEVFNSSSVSMANFTGGLTWNSTLLNDINLTGYWQFENNANDMKGYHTTTASTATYTDGKYGRSANYSTKLSTITANNNLKNVGMNLTVCAWVLPTTVIGLDGIIGNNFNGGVGQGGWWFILNAGKPAIMVNGSGTVATALTVINSGGTVWSHICVNFNNTFDSKFYINGALDSTSTDLNNILGDGSNTFYIGDDGRDGAGYPFDGKIDDIAVFNRTLSADEILQLYKNTNKQTTLFINNSYLSNGNLTTVNDSFKIAAYLKGNGTSTPVIDDIIGYYTATTTPPVTEFYQCYYSNSTGVNITNMSGIGGSVGAFTVLSGENLRCNDTYAFINDDYTTGWIENYGNLTFDNFNLTFNVTGDGNAYLYSEGAGTKLTVNNSNITTMEDSYSIFGTTNTLVVINYSAISYTGWADVNYQRGIEIVGGVINITNSTIDNSYIGVTLQTDNNYLSNNTITTASSYGIYLSNANSNTVQFNNLSLEKLYADASNYNIIINNTLTGTGGLFGGNGLYLNGSDFNLIENNTISKYQNDLYLTYSENNIAKRNIIYSGSTNGVANFDGVNNTFDLNTVYSSSRGFDTSTSNTSTYSNNTIYDCATGILDEDSNNDTIANNTIYGTVGTCSYGMKAATTTFNSTFEYNTVYNCSNGIYVSGATENMIRYNTVDNATNGVYVTSSQDNTFTNNTLHNSGTYDYYEDTMTAGDYNTVYNMTFNDTTASFTSNNIVIKDEPNPPSATTGLGAIFNGQSFLNISGTWIDLNLSYSGIATTRVDIYKYTTSWVKQSGTAYTTYINKNLSSFSTFGVFESATYSWSSQIANSTTSEIEFWAWNWTQPWVNATNQTDTLGIFNFTNSGNNTNVYISANTSLTCMSAYMSNSSSLTNGVLVDNSTRRQVYYNASSTTTPFNFWMYSNFSNCDLYGTTLSDYVAYYLTGD